MRMLPRQLLRQHCQELIRSFILFSLSTTRSRDLRSKYVCVCSALCSLASPAYCYCFIVYSANRTNTYHCLIGFSPTLKTLRSPYFCLTLFLCDSLSHSLSFTLALRTLPPSVFPHRSLSCPHSQLNLNSNKHIRYQNRRTANRSIVKINRIILVKFLHSIFF